jgi:serine/threonine protein phosphatase PrpC
MGILDRFIKRDLGPLDDLSVSPGLIEVPEGDSQSIEELCRRIHEMMEIGHVRCNQAELMGLQDALRTPGSLARQQLAPGFHRLVVIETARGLNDRGQFDYDRRFLPYLRGVLFQAFDIEQTESTHPEQIIQLLKDERRSLFCFLDAQHIPETQIQLLRGFTQGVHRILLCGPANGASRPQESSHATVRIQDLFLRVTEGVKRLLGSPRFEYDFSGNSKFEGDSPDTEEYAFLSSFTLLPNQMKLRVGVVSVAGNNRENNEDNFSVPGRRSVRHDSDSEGDGHVPTLTFEPSSVFIVADGMGGQQAGEQASLMAVELIPRAIARRLSPEEQEPGRIKDAIREAVADVNQEIMDSAKAIAEYSNMGTTVVLAQFRLDRVYVAGIGDSRAYRLRDGRLEQFTKDHSLADALLDAGTITPAELPNHKFKNVLYLYLGSKDARGGPEDVRELDVRPGDRFLMATDGLTSVVLDQDIGRILGTVDDPQEAARVLKNFALANDSKDNVTCLIIHAIAQRN